MPIGFAYAPDVDLDRLDQGAASLPIDQGLRVGAEFGAPANPNGLAPIAGQMVAGPLDYLKHAFLDTLGIDPEDPVSQGNSFGDVDRRIPAETANQRYGVDGYLRFNQPVTDEDAGWLAAQAHEKQFSDVVLSKTRPNPLMDFGASLAGGLVNPVNLALMAATGPVGDLAVASLGLKGAGETGLALSRIGRLANGAGRVAAEGLAVNAPFVAASAGLNALEGNDYDFGDALRDLAIGATFHSALHGLGAAGRALRTRFGALPDEAATTAPPSAMVPPEGVPEAVQDLPATARMGAFAKAVDDMADDRPVDVGQYVQRELDPPDVGRLDESTALAEMEAFRPLDEDMAITPRGGEVPVRYGLAELGELTTSHDDNLQPNPAYPQELQPRDRARAGAQARNYQLEAELNPKLLMAERSAASGAPIVAPDGTVESGNGRLIALRRSAATGTDAWGRYQAELKAQGYDATGMKQPVLVRMRAQALSGAQRAALAREMNADVTERMSGVEQARADARRLDDALTPETDRLSVGDRDFTRAFIDRVAPDQVAGFVDRDGRLSPEGARRIRAALLARAYEDPRLVGQVFEGEETAARQLGEALADAAPQWARMRALARAGEIPRELDLTPALNSAMDLVRYAKAEGVELGELLRARLGQQEMFSGEAISPATEAFLRLMFRDEALKKPTPRDKLTWALKDYARQAMAVTPGENLFGETAGEDTSRQILENLADRFARNDPPPIDIRPPGRPDGPAAEPVVIDLRRPVPAGDGGSGDVPRQGGDGAEGAGGGPGGAAAAAGQRRVVPAAAAAEAYAKAFRDVASRHAEKVAEIQQRIAELEAQAKAADKIVDTRGAGEQYHGARGPITQLEEGYYSPDNIYGGFDTFYTTDAIDVAKGYGRKNPSALVYKVRERAPVRMYDMEEPHPQDHWERLFGVGSDDFGFPSVSIEEAAAEHGGRPNLRQVMDQIRADSRAEGYSKADVQEIFDTAIHNLTSEGFDGMRHVGGLLTDRAPHEVKIYFKAHEQLELSPTEIPRTGVPAEVRSELQALNEELGKTEAAAARAAGHAGAQAAEAERAASSGQKLIDSTPELKALRDATLRLAAENGLELPTDPKQDPDTLAEALHAAAVCLAEESA